MSLATALVKIKRKFFDFVVFMSLATALVGSTMHILLISFELHVQIGYLRRYFVKQKKVEKIFKLSALVRIFQKGTSTDVGKSNSVVQHYKIILIEMKQRA